MPGLGTAGGDDTEDSFGFTGSAKGGGEGDTGLGGPLVTFDFGGLTTGGVGSGGFGGLGSPAGVAVGDPEGVGGLGGGEDGFPPRALVGGVDLGTAVGLVTPEGGRLFSIAFRIRERKPQCQ